MAYAVIGGDATGEGRGICKNCAVLNIPVNYPMESEPYTLVYAQKAWAANDWKPPKKVLPTNQTYRRCLDREEFLEKRAAEEAEGERIRKRKGQSASFGMLYGHKVGAALRAVAQVVSPPLYALWHTLGVR